jgi:gluconolactonase
MSWEYELVAGPYGSPTDGPCWDGQGLLFTRLVLPPASPDNRILRYTPETGEVSDFRRWTHPVTGLAFSPNGILYGCQSGSRRVIRFDPDGSAWAMSHKVGGEYHNEPKDLVVDSQGRIWFSDPCAPAPGTRAQFASRVPYAAILRMEAPPNRDSAIQRMTFDTSAPSAVLLSKDERTLYVSENSSEVEGKRELRAYPILGNGTLGVCRVLATFGSDARGVHRGINGMCLDSEGNIIACAGGQQSGPGPMVCVFSPEGRILETSVAPQGEPTNCTFGDPDLGTLYITTSDGRLYRVRGTGRKGWLLYPKPR